MKLRETLFFEELSEEVVVKLAPYIENIDIKQVEVFPKEGKWVLHLSSSCVIEEDLLQIIVKSLEIRLKNDIKIEIKIDHQEIVSLDNVCHNYWGDILQEILEIVPSLRGWLNSDVRYETEKNRLTLFVPNLMAMEHCQMKSDIIEDYFKNKYRLTAKVIWEIDNVSDDEVGYFDTEKEERRIVEEILAANPVKKDIKANTVLYGKEFKGTARFLQDIVDEERQIIVEGEVCEAEIRLLKSGRQLLTFGITDKTNSIGCKVFLEEGQNSIKIAQGDWLMVRGPVQFDRYTTELTLMARDIMSMLPKRIEDNAEEKRVELHLHTQMSEMDGLSSVQSLIKRASEWGHEAIAVTDHGVVQAYPDAIDAGKKYGVKVILGMEGYLVDDLEEKKNETKRKSSNHIIILAKNQVGLKNIYKLVTYSHLEHFYRRPLIPRSLLMAHREGLVLGSACEAGELYRALLQGADINELTRIASYYDYLEIQPVANNMFLVNRGDVANVDALRQINQRIVQLGRDLSKPVVATCDVHFLDNSDEIYRRILLAGKGFADADQPTPLYYRTTEEMLEEFSYLGEEAYEVVVTNPRQIAAQIEDLKPFPDDFFEPKIEGASDKIISLSWQKAHRLYGDPLPEVVRTALQKELDSIIGNGFSVLYLISHLLVKKSNEDGYLVGSRGSVGSSLVATFTDITEVNPLPPHYRCLNQSCLYSEFISDGSVDSGVDLPEKECPKCGQELEKDGHNIPFETFLGFKGDKVPDIDLNFSGEYQSRAHRYTEEVFGKENVFKAGTISTVAEKTAFGFVKNYLDEREVKYNQTEINRLVQGCAGVKRTTGQHPGGLMVIPKECDIFDFTPLQRPANDTKSEITTTHFDYHSISGRLVKLDILGHDDPTSIKMLEDLTGVDAKKIRLDDEKTLSLFSGTEALEVSTKEIGVKTGTLGIPEFGTKFVRQMLEDIKPKTFSHLVRVSGLSHGTNVWVGNAQDLVLDKVADISEIIACRDDIMIYLIQKGLDSSHAFNIMEAVRKGKGLKPDDIEAMQKQEVPEWYIESCQKISYMFPKAHAVAYVTMAFRIAWFKIYYPEAFYATFFTVRADEFDIDLITQGLTRCKEMIKEINNKGNNASPKEKNILTILELAVEMYCRNINLLKVNLWESDATRFQLTPQGILPPFSSLQGLGKSAAANIAKLRDQGIINSVQDLQTQAKLSKTVIEVLQQHGCLKDLPDKNQLSLF